MSETPVKKYDGFCSQINDKPVDAIGHMAFTFDFDHFETLFIRRYKNGRTSPFQVEKVLGLMVQGHLYIWTELLPKFFW